MFLRVGVSRSMHNNDHNDHNNHNNHSNNNNNYWVIIIIIIIIIPVRGPNFRPLFFGNVYICRQMTAAELETLRRSSNQHHRQSCKIWVFVHGTDAPRPHTITIEKTAPLWLVASPARILLWEKANSISTSDFSSCLAAWTRNRPPPKKPGLHTL